MKITSKIDYKVGKIIDDEYRIFTFTPKGSTEVPDEYGKALIKTYPFLTEVVSDDAKDIPTTGDIGIANNDSLEELKKQLTAAKTKKTKAVKASQAEPDNIGLQEAALEADSCVTELENKIKTAFPDTE